MSDTFFRKEIVTAKIKNPMKDFNLSEENIEIRWDPLLKYTSRITRSKGLDKVPEGKPLADFVSSAKSCFFCKGRVESQTPMLPDTIDPSGRISVGQALLFPNLSGFGTYSGVCIFSKQHYLAIGDFGTDLITNALRACQIYLQKCAAQDSRTLFPSLNWNYLLPAGSSILHPHLQPFMDPLPTNMYRQLLEGSRNFRESHHKNYWDILKEEETEIGERFLFATENCFIYVPFAPQGFNEVHVIVGEGESFIKLKDEVVREMSVIIKKILSYYDSINHNSLNLTLFSPAINSNDTGHFPCLMKICSRPVFQEHYRNEITFFEKFHMENMLDKYPEAVAEEIRTFL
jgi:galactose-1-phosphate uridylyltransferase